MDGGGCGCDDAEGGENDDCEGGENDVEGSPQLMVSSAVSPDVSTFCASEGTGVVGTKNLVPTVGFTDVVEGDLNEFVKDPPVLPAPPLLNVSTYLDLTPILARDEN